ncbi:MAG TPA: hypothetical protein VFZ41_00130 [Solirubrobacterales bacterium]
METIPFSRRSRKAQLLLAIGIPLVFGAVVGVALGAAALAYWILSALAAIGGVLAGLEHPDARSASLRGLVIGAVYGIGLLLSHAVTGADAEVSLGSFPPLLIAIDAAAGAVLVTTGSWLAGHRDA